MTKKPANTRKKKAVLAKIIDQPDLVRDVHSNAIINRNRSAYSDHVARRQRRLKQESEISDLRSQLAEIRTLLTDLLNKQND